MKCRMLNEDQATGEAKALYEDIKANFGMVPNFFKAQAAVDPAWAALNWQRVKHIMLSEGGLERKTREIIAMVVAIMKGCRYCDLAHETMARMSGATDQELEDAMKVVELIQSFTSIADSLEVPCDVTPTMAKQAQ